MIALLMAGIRGTDNARAGTAAGEATICNVPYLFPVRNMFLL
jgi:hypothetical protein